MGLREEKSRQVFRPEAKSANVAQPFAPIRCQPERWSWAAASASAASGAAAVSAVAKVVRVWAQEAAKSGVAASAGSSDGHSTKR